MTPAMQACLVAVRRGPLINEGSHYRFGRRLFNPATVNALRAMGERIIMPTPSRPARTHRVCVTLNDDELAVVKDVAGDEDRSVADTIRRLMAEALKVRREER